MDPSVHPLFIHASFRSGSTLLWSALRSQDSIAYFEPLHEDLAHYTQSRAIAPSRELSGKLSGNSIENLFSSYDDLIDDFGGVKKYRSEFSVDRYFLQKNDTDNNLYSYISGLIENANTRGKRPIFKFVRSQGRIGWLRNTFPGTHVAILRSPFSQFCSYIWNARHGNWYFFAVTALIVYRNSIFAHSAIKSMLDISPTSGTIFEQNKIMTKSVREMNVYQLYFLFFYIWKRCTQECVGGSDICIDLLGNPASLDRLRGLIDIDDVNVHAINSENELIYDERFRTVEKLVKRCMMEDRTLLIPPDESVHDEIPPWLLAEIQEDKMIMSSECEFPPDFSLWSALGSNIKLGKRTKIKHSGSFGIQSVVDRTLYSERTVGESGPELVQEAQAMMVADAAYLHHDPFYDRYKIDFDFFDESLVFTGFIENVSAGDYRIIFDIETSMRSDARESDYPRVSVDIHDDSGDVVISRSAINVEDGNIKSVNFTIEHLCANISVRVFAFRVLGSFMKYRIIKRYSNEISLLGS